MWRAMANLKTGKRDIMRGQAFSQRDMPPHIAAQLLAAGRIEPVHAPPCAALPGMGEYAAALQAAGAEMCDTFVDSDPAVLADALGLGIEQVRRLQEAVCRTLDSPQPRG